MKGFLFIDDGATRGRVRCGIHMFVFGILLLHPVAGTEDSSTQPVSPEGTAPATDKDFLALRTSSPFLRSLDLSESLILTGIARIKGDVFATLLDRAVQERR